MNKQSSLYRPTPFWEEGSRLIIDELEEYDIKDFRRLTNNRDFFVPCYSFPYYINNKERYLDFFDILDDISNDPRTDTKLERLFNGRLQAHSDYRTFLASNIDKVPHISEVSESTIGNPIEQYEFNNKMYSRSMLNYLLGLNFLKQNVDTSTIRTVMEIGGGFGTLGEILLQDERNEAFYINADIPPVSFASAYYLKEVFGQEVIADYGDLSECEEINIEKLKLKYKALNVCSWQVPKLKGKIDLFVNFISFQEMEPDVVSNYCKYIEKLAPKYILLRNMLEGKRKLASDYLAGVKEPILGEDYNKFFPNYKLVKSDSEIYGFITEDNFHSQLRIYERN